MTFMDEEGLADVLMEPANNIVDLKLTCCCLPDGNVTMGMNGSIGEILPIFKNWQHLRRLSLVGDRSVDVACPAQILVCGFIFEMPSSTHLCISDRFDWRKMNTWRSVVDNYVQQSRPGFIFGISSSNPFSFYD